MKIYTELNNEHKNLSLALGFFDGVHIGHKEVIRKAVSYARENGLKSAVVTFSSHPAEKFNKNFEGYVMPPAERFEYFEKLGVDYCWALDFEKLTHVSAENYIKAILVQSFAPKAITSGFNHHFGKNREGSTELLKELSLRYGYNYFEIPPVLINNVTVSSSIVREFIQCGDIKNLNKFLGHDFLIKGNVQTGEKIASKLGFKTANLNYPQKCTKLKFGVYGVNLNFDGTLYKGIANFGVKPTFCPNIPYHEPVLEVHILDFNNDIYNQNVTVDFKKFIRPEKKFNSCDELINQIKADIATAKR